VTVQKDLVVRVHSYPEDGYETYGERAAAEMVLLPGFEYPYRGFRVEIRESKETLIA